MALVLARDQAISYWRELVGPTNTFKARETHPDWYVINRIYHEKGYYIMQEICCLSTFE